MADDIRASVDKGIRDIRDTVAKSISDLQWNLDKAGKDTEKTGAKAAKDIEAEVGRAGKHTEEAVSAIGHYIEAEAHSAGKALSNAEKRVREGKVIDALWHLGTEPLQASEENAANAALESSLIRTVGQVAASVYGGPGGAAAYAAWLTFHETGDPNLALRVGILTGASSVAFSNVSNVDFKGDFALAQKTVVTGAIGGLTVAAAGGNAEAIKDGFLTAGAMVLVQDGYQRVTQHKLDPSSSKGEAYCMEVGKACSPPPESVLETDGKGNILKVDMTKVDPSVPAVGVKEPGPGVSWQGENSKFMTSLSRIPGMQAMAVFHDQWALTWDMDLLTKPTIVPAIVLTYAGTTAPYFEHLRRSTIDAAARASVAGAAPPVPTEPVEPPSGPVFGQDKEGPARALKPPASPEDVLESYMCANEAQTRMILVKGGVKSAGVACSVSYNREEGNIVLWSAKHDKTFCSARAKDLVVTNLTSGWSCFKGSADQQRIRSQAIEAEKAARQAAMPGKN